MHYSDHVCYCDSYPDEDAGQIPMAFVVRKPGSNISASEIIDFVAKQVINYCYQLDKLMEDKLYRKKTDISSIYLIIFIFLT